MRSFVFIAIGAAILGTAVFGQSPYTPARTPDGQPNIEGSWQPRAGGAAYSSSCAHCDGKQAGFYLARAETLTYWL
jgi:hypothetical protein